MCLQMSARLQCEYAIGVMHPCSKYAPRTNHPFVLLGYTTLTDRPSTNIASMRVTSMCTLCSSSIPKALFFSLVFLLLSLFFSCSSTHRFLLAIGEEAVDGWLFCVSVRNGSQGFVPANYVQRISWEYQLLLAFVVLMMVVLCMYGNNKWELEGVEKLIYIIPSNLIGLEFGYGQFRYFGSKLLQVFGMLWGILQIDQHARGGSLAAGRGTKVLLARHVDIRNVRLLT